MFVFWPWIGLIAALTVIVAILTIRFAGRVTLRLRNKKQHPHNVEDVDYGGDVVPGFDDQYPDGGVQIQDPDCSIQFDEMTPSEVGGYPASVSGQYPPSDRGGGYAPSNSGSYNPQQYASSMNEQML